ncbi:MAG: TonB-dependent receptor [Bacteroidia bacterium]|nr:TonB-dependent receptor [Bacteroidia bacterium]
MKFSFAKRVGLMLALASMVLGPLGSLQAQVQTTKLKGKVAKNGEELAASTVKVFQDGHLVMGVITDSLGNYSITNMNAGTYTLQVWYLGQEIAIMEDVVVQDGKYKTVNFAISEMDDQVIHDYRDNPMMDIDNVSSGSFVDRKTIEKLPVRQPEDIIRILPGVNSTSERDPLKIRGARPGATVMFVDGVKVIGNTNLPNAMIEQVSVITGGIPAEFGDVSGGVISITTRNSGMRPSMGGIMIGKKKKAPKAKKSTSPDSGKVNPEQLFRVDSSQSNNTFIIS